MIFEELLGLIDLSRAQTFYIYKTTKFVVTDKYKDFMLATF